MKSDKFVKPREPIDFAAYKSKLTLTKAGYDALEVNKQFASSPHRERSTPDFEKSAAMNLIFNGDSN